MAETDGELPVQKTSLVLTLLGADVLSTLGNKGLETSRPQGQAPPPAATAAPDLEDPSVFPRWWDGRSGVTLGKGSYPDPQRGGKVYVAPLC